MYASTIVALLDAKGGFVADCNITFCSKSRCTPVNTVATVPRPFLLTPARVEIGSRSHRTAVARDEFYLDRPPVFGAGQSVNADPAAVKVLHVKAQSER